MDPCRGMERNVQNTLEINAVQELSLSYLTSRSPGGWPSSMTLSCDL